MELATTFKFLHIAVMFAAVGVSVGSEILLHSIARSGNVAVIRGAFELARPLNRLIPALFGLGVLFGLLTAWLGGYNLLAPWLLIAYVLFVIAAAMGAVIAAPWAEKVARAAADSGTDAPSDELVRIAHDRTARLAMLVSWVIIVAFIFDMVVKPFS